MAKLYGQTMKRRELEKRVGDLNQLADMRLMSFEEGKARGMRSIECKNGAGLEFTILPDRGMDIAWASYQGYAFGYLSKSAVSKPEYFLENGDKGFLDNFYAGVLTTSGLSNVGSSNTDQGKQYGMHGVISNLPAINLSLTKEWQDDEYVLSAKGTIRQSRFYGEDLKMTRTITTKLGENKIIIHDVFANNGYEKQPFMLLYHMNFGYPFLSEDSQLFVNPGSIKARTAEAEKGLPTCAELSGPVHGYQEQCFYHDFEADEQGKVCVGLHNPQLGSGGLSVYLSYRKAELPYFCQWKQLGEQEYVMGLIPANSYAEGRSAAREKEQLVWMQPGEQKEVTLELGIIE